MANLTQRQEAVCELLSRDDPPDLPARLHRWRWRRAVNPDRLKQALLLAWWARREIETQPYESARIARFRSRLASERTRVQS